MRVVDTPITELGFAGVGVGAAMVGLRPVIEFMTWNFALLAHRPDRELRRQDALHVGRPVQRARSCSAGPAARRCSSPRSTRRRSRRGYAHIPGLKVVTPATPADAKGLLKSAIRDDNPVVFIEGEMLYNTKGEVPEGEYLVPLGKADVKRAGGDVTIICHSKMVRVALKAAEQLAARGDRRRGGRPAHDPPAGHRGGARRRWQDQPLPSWSRKAGPSPASARRWSTRSSARSSTSSTRRCSGCTGADVPMPYNKHLEQAAKVDPPKVDRRGQEGPVPGVRSQWQPRS